MAEIQFRATLSRGEMCSAIAEYLERRRTTVPEGKPSLLVDDDRPDQQFILVVNQEAV